MRDRRWALALAGGSLLLLLLLVLLRVPLLQAVGRSLVVDDAPVQSDVIYLLNGDHRVVARAGHAAALYHRGVAPRIVIARSQDWPASRKGYIPNETDINLWELSAAGVPREAITLLRTPGGSASTTDEGALLRWYVDRHGVARVTVVTTDYHTRRARWAMRRSLKGSRVELRMSAAPNPEFSPDAWWRTEEGMLANFQEYLKFAHNWVYR